MKSETAMLALTSRSSGRATLAKERIPLAQAALRNCILCGHECGVDRAAGQLGVCRSGPDARIFLAQTEVTDELCLIPVFAIGLSGCDLRCGFCITGDPSWNPSRGNLLNPAQVSAAAVAAVNKGAKSIMILGGEPTVHLPSVLGLVAALPEEAFLIWKTNAHGTAAARQLLAGLFDLWLADYKFGNDECAWRLARVRSYEKIVRDNLLWAAANGQLIIRHLLMPGHIECCWRPVAAWLAERLPGVAVNLRSGFWPAWQAGRHGLGRTIREDEAEKAWVIAADYELLLVE